MRLLDYIERDMIKLFSDQYNRTADYDIKIIEKYYNDISDECIRKSIDIDSKVNSEDWKRLCKIQPISIEYDSKKDVYKMVMNMYTPTTNTSTLGIYHNNIKMPEAYMVHLTIKVFIL